MMSTDGEERERAECVYIQLMHGLAFELIANHPFIDGNKRIGTHAILIFLTLNNVELEYDDDNLITLILGTAAGENDDKTIFIIFLPDSDCVFISLMIISAFGVREPVS